MRGPLEVNRKESPPGLGERKGIGGRAEAVTGPLPSAETCSEAFGTRTAVSSCAPFSSFNSLMDYPYFTC